MIDAVAGPTNSLHDVAGMQVGHAQRIGQGWLSGTTCVLAPAHGVVGGVDVRGGGPGTHETDLLDPRNMVDRVHAVVLTGGSAYGLAAASGVADALGADGVGWPVGTEPHEVVPIVPAAVIFDLGRGGDFGARPGVRLGQQAYRDAQQANSAVPVAQGNVGAGTGALAGGLKGGVGSASAVLPGGGVVAALVVVNSLGSCVDLRTGRLSAIDLGLEAEFAGLGSPHRHDLEAARARAAAEAGGQGRPRYGLATTLGVLATDVGLSKAQCQKLAGIGHDGMARAIRPVHTMADGDTVFALSTGTGPGADPERLHLLLSLGADVLSRAIGHALLAATSVRTAGGELRSYRDAFPSAFGVRGTSEHGSAAR